MTTGWTDVSQKPAAVSVPRSVWTDIATIGAADGLAEGPTILNPQLYATLPAKPTGKETILTRWARMGQQDGDARYTAREPHELGDRIGWSSTRATSLEFVGADDLPLVLQCYHTFLAPIVFTTIVAKAHNPAAYIAARTSPDPND